MVFLIQIHLSSSHDNQIRTLVLLRRSYFMQLFSQEYGAKMLLQRLLLQDILAGRTQANKGSFLPQSELREGHPRLPSQQAILGHHLRALVGSALLVNRSELP